MAASFLSGFAHGEGPLRDVCLALPSLFLADNDLHGAADALLRIIALIPPTPTVQSGDDGEAGGLVPVSRSNAAPDVFASLWFIRAAHLFGETARQHPALADPTLFPATFLPASKKILQTLISEKGSAGVRMDDGGLLIPPPAAAGQTLRVNALWYSALQTTAVDLKAAGDPVSDHFERLAGRFRRSFAKAYWCDIHGCICTPESRATPDHSELPHPDQLLLTFLPDSPIPRTKQRQSLQCFRIRAMGARGILIHDPVHGVVESPLYLAWLGLGFLASADPPGSGVAEATALLEPLMNLRSEAHGDGVPAWYPPGQSSSTAPADPMTTAEVLGALKALNPSA